VDAPWNHEEELQLRFQELTGLHSCYAKCMGDNNSLIILEYLYLDLLGGIGYNPVS